MTKNTIVSLYASLIVLIGFPVVFFTVSLLTKQWGYLIFSIPGSLTAGLTGLLISLQLNKNEHNSV
ncbi:hypothetical protein [Bacillus gobiensis]|uniref:hypothetical protein n=1 Tax=Bacillus gobiensis TaxID=1441095 RepID=UPI003D2029E3